MIASDHTYKAGDIMVFEHGEYSDFRYTGPFRALRSFSRSEVVTLFRAQWKPQGNPYGSGWYVSHPDSGDFIAWLNREGYIEDQPSTSWHIGSYGEFTP